MSRRSTATAAPIGSCSTCPARRPVPSTGRSPGAAGRPCSRSSRSPPTPRLGSPPPVPSPLEAELIGRGITPAMAGDLVRDHGEENDPGPGRAPRLAGREEAGEGRRPGGLAGGGHPERPCRSQGIRLEGRASGPRGGPAGPGTREGRAAPPGEGGGGPRPGERERVDAEIKRLTPAERAALEAEALARASSEERELYDNPPTPPSAKPPCAACCCGTSSSGLGTARAWPPPTTMERSEIQSEAIRVRGASGTVLLGCGSAASGFYLGKTDRSETDLFADAGVRRGERHPIAKLVDPGRGTRRQRRRWRRRRSLPHASWGLAR